VNIAGFLSRHGITLEAVVAEAKAAVRLSPGDVLFVSGSLAEGLGNEKSDLDLFLLTPRTDIQFTSLNDVTVVVGPCVVDIRVVQHAAVEELLGHFDRWARQPRMARKAFEFVEDDRRLLHRLKIGQALFGEDDFGRLQSRIDAADLARHKLDWARHLAEAIQVDLAGLLVERDPYTMLFAAQDLLGQTIDGLLAGHGFTNPGQKWRARQLGLLPDTWELDLPGRRSGLSPIDRYLSLHRAPESLTLGTALHHALRIVAFSRRVFPWAEHKLLGPRERLPPALVAGDPPIPQKALPHLDLDVEVRYRDGGFELRRLNEEGAAFQLSPQSFSLLSLFDGETSRERAVAHAETLGGDRSGAELLEELQTVIRYARFTAPVVVDEQALAALLRR
jgi:hypothetical protein